MLPHQFWSWPLCLTLLMLSGCWSSGSGGTTTSVPSGSDKKTLQIVATTGMVADLVRSVVGAHGNVKTLIGTGVDPHLFKTTRHVINLLHEADIVFYSGLMLEGRMQDALQQVNRPEHPVIAVTERLEKDFLRSPPEFEGHYDPHVWMDVVAWSRCLDVIVDVMVKIDPDHADEFRQNAQHYQAELVELDEYITTVIKSIPDEHRVLVTAHDAFGYFGRRYGIEVRSVQGVTTESEAGIQDVNRLVDFLVQRKLPAIFVESSVNEKNIRAVIEGTTSRKVTVRIGGELYSDAMGSEGTYEGTYIGMLDHNATRISAALGGAPPERGFRGKLSVAVEERRNAWQGDERCIQDPNIVARSFRPSIQANGRAALVQTGSVTCLSPLFHGSTASSFNNLFSALMLRANCDLFRGRSQHGQYLGT
ncbi:metal ABC transporter solute-binding protein, Zn/Mn family [Schlesneria paludicola]|uniref:metal ABC transporter solute-binding protein, Zn/Mn family n=1 Tax=Schlesneria paludicola TaxID=360056 RepID=UPI00029A9060|nr:zinc ABC transporter substrate-binding protein [Schlesneria paludicola]